MASTTKMMSSASIKIQKLGVRYHPPTIFIFYVDTSTGKLRRRTVVIDDFTKTTNITDYAKELHSDKTSRKRNLFQYIQLRRIQRLLFVLKEGLKPNVSKAEIELKLRQFDGLDANEDLNKLDDDTLKHKKLIMDESFEKNRIDPTSKDFVYDKNIDFTQTAEEQYAAGWDSAEEIEEDIKQADDDSNNGSDDDDFQ